MYSSLGTNEALFDQIHSVETELWRFEDDSLKIVSQTFEKIPFRLEALM